ILLDVDMPIMNGIEALEEIKNNSSTKDVPVIMLTARTEAETFEKAIDNQVDRYVAKPFKSQFLIEKVNQVLDKYD
ncbi:MAG: response regulator, partial [Elusimicrobiota bacterium]